MFRIGQFGNKDNVDVTKICFQIETDNEKKSSGISKDLKIIAMSGFSSPRLEII